MSIYRDTCAMLIIKSNVSWIGQFWYDFVRNANIKNPFIKFRHHHPDLTYICDAKSHEHQSCGVLEFLQKKYYGPQISCCSVVNCPTRCYLGFCDDHLSQHPDNRETGYSNVLDHDQTWNAHVKNTHAWPSSPSMCSNLFKSFCLTKSHISSAVLYLHLRCSCYSGKISHQIYNHKVRSQKKPYNNISPWYKHKLLNSFLWN